MELYLVRKFVLISRFIFVVMIGLLVVKNASADEVTYDFIEANSYHIQVGAFKSRDNVNNVKNRLSAFDVYIEPYKGLNRVIVVNILTEEQLNHSFLQIKKIYPKAFITKQPMAIVKVQKKHSYKKPVEDYNQLFKPTSIKREIIEQRNDTLNSNTILKTRKSFL